MPRGTCSDSSPTVLPVSARLAQKAKQGEPSLWAASRFEALEQYLRDTLDAPSRFRLKLANPLGVGQALAHRYTTIASERLTLMEDDLQLLADIERQLAVYREDMERGFELRMAAVEKELADMEARGHRFFEDTLRIGRVVDLLNRARVQKEFEEKVVADAPMQIERRVTEMIDWLVDQDFRQWQAVTSKLSERHRQHASRMLGAPDVGTFHNDRSRLIDSVGREAQRVVDTYDKRREAEVIADQARTAVAAAAAAGGAAVGLGTLVTIAASTVAADVTGILLASVVLGVGFLIIPARRRRAKATLEEKVAALRSRLTSALQTEFERAREQSGHRLGDAMAPYARFVRFGGAALERGAADARPAAGRGDRVAHAGHGGQDALAEGSVESLSAVPGLRTAWRSTPRRGRVRRACRRRDPRRTLTSARPASQRGLSSGTTPAQSQACPGGRRRTAASELASGCWPEARSRLPRSRHR